MIFLKGRQCYKGAVSLVCLACLFLLFFPVNSQLAHADGGSQGAGQQGSEARVAELTTATLWFNGTAALWRRAIIKDNKDKLIKALSKDGGVPEDHKGFLDFKIIPHSAEFDSMKPHIADGVGVDVIILSDTPTPKAHDVKKNIIAKTTSGAVSELVGDTFGRPVSAFDGLPTDTETIKNNTIAINNPIDFWKAYLSATEKTIPMERPYNLSDDVMKYMPLDLQDALGADPSQYQILPTAMWTNSTSAYINYTVYKTKDGADLKPEDVHKALEGKALPKFEKAAQEYVAKRLPDYKGLPKDLKLREDSKKTDSVSQSAVNGGPDRGVPELTTATLWFNGTAALWKAIIKEDKIKLKKALSKDGGVPEDHKGFLDFTIIPHSAEFDSMKPHIADGVGVDVTILSDTPTPKAHDVKKNIIAKTTSGAVSELVGDTFGRPVSAFDGLPTDTETIKNNTIAINNPIDFWKAYLSATEKTIPMERPYNLSDDVMKYMPLDLQDALGADPSQYQILPTAMWTNSTSAYINYTVYKTKDGADLKPEDVHKALEGKALPKFEKAAQEYVAKRLPDYKGLPKDLKLREDSKKTDSVSQSAVNGGPDRGVPELTTATLWFNGTAALWKAIIKEDKIKLKKALSKDGGVPEDHKGFLDFTIIPHSAEFDSMKPHIADGVGVDVTILSDTPTPKAHDVKKNIIAKTTSGAVSELVGDTFGRPVSAFDGLPTDTEMIKNNTIAINNPIVFWHAYLKATKKTIPKERPYNLSDDVMKYMPLDLQDALGADPSQYQIMPTAMWTNSTGAYINYTVYAAEYVSQDSSLTPQEIHRRLCGSYLPQLDKSVREYVADKLPHYSGLMPMPVMLRRYLPPPPRSALLPLTTVNTVTARFIIHFSGERELWERVLKDNIVGWKANIQNCAEKVLSRAFFITRVNITDVKFQNAGRKGGNLLVHGRVDQDELLLARQPWNEEDIVGVLSAGDYAPALALYKSMTQMPAKLSGVSLDADFSDVHVVHFTMMLIIIAITSALTILSVIGYVLHICCARRRNAKHEELNRELFEAYPNVFSAPICKPGAPLYDLDQAVAMQDALAYTPLSRSLGRVRVENKPSSVRTINPDYPSRNTFSESKAISGASLIYS